jgi:hypothetical protein
MTNGTVSSAGASGGAKQITVTYKGGSRSSSCRRLRLSERSRPAASPM